MCLGLPRAWWQGSERAHGTMAEVDLALKAILLHSSFTSKSAQSQEEGNLTLFLDVWVSRVGGREVKLHKSMWDRRYASGHLWKTCFSRVLQRSLCSLLLPPTEGVVHLAVVCSDISSSTSFPY